MDIKAQGLDISKWQGEIDWDALGRMFDAGAFRFLILRAGLGYSSIDPKFESYYTEARRRGIPCGAYWYAYWSQGTPEQEARAFLAATAGKTLQYGIWYDVEYERSITSLDNKTRTDKVLEALDALQASGRYVGLYASTDMVNNRLEYSRLHDYDLWVAQYGSVCTCQRDFGMWQYTSSGKMQGIAGNVDLDHAYKDYPAIITGALALCETASAAPTITEQSKPRVTKTMRIGPMTGGDLKSILDAAENLSLYRVGFVDIGPMTEGDLAAMKTLAENLRVSYVEV